MEPKNLKILLGLVIIAAVFAGAFVFSGNRNEASPPDDSSGLIIGNSSIYVAEQAPSRNISVAVVRLEGAGFVVVHEDTSGIPGGVLGVSGVLPAGEIKNPAPIPLSRMTQDGETLYAMLHLDDGDGVFDAAKDKPFLDAVGAGPVMMIIDVSRDAIEPGEVKL